MEQILRLGEKLEFLKENIVYRKEEPAKFVYFINWGTVLLTNDEQHSTSFARKGTFLGLVEALSDRTYCVNAVAFTHAEIYKIDAQKLIQISDCNSEVNHFLLTELTQISMLRAKAFE